MAEKKKIKKKIKNKNQKKNFVDDQFKDPDFAGLLVKVKEDKTKACC